MVFSSLFKSKHEKSADNSRFNQQQEIPITEEALKEGDKSSKSRRKRRKKSATAAPLPSREKSLTDEKNLIHDGKTKWEKTSSTKDRNSKKRQRPSAEALDLSARLKEHSKYKRLREALDLYWDDANESIRDGHHACIVVDCCSRCGAIQQGEQVIDEMEKRGAHVNVETKTALLKGYVHAGDLHKAMALFESMCNSKAKCDLPNVRTFNTLLRGCLWTAATENEGVVAGGVISSEAAWTLFGQKCCFGGADKVDLSSYEYSVTLLCQSLRFSAAEHRVEELKRAYRVSASASDLVDRDVMEALAVCYHALARMYFLLHKVDETRGAVISGLKYADEALACSATTKSGLGKSKHVAGGKQAWRHSEDEECAESRRGESNTIFRTHRLREIKGDLLVIRQSCENQNCLLSPVEFAQHLFLKLKFISGGGSTDLAACDDNAQRHATNKDNLDGLNRRLVRNTWASFGLRTALANAQYTKQLPENQTDLTAKDIKRMQQYIGLPQGPTVAEGYLNFKHIFQRGDDEDVPACNFGKPLDIELGSGFGEWIVQQAKNNPTRNFVAVELRADRVAQIFAKAIATGTGPPLKNLCVVGSECGAFLSNYVKNGSVSTIFVNHPEPPTQTYGAEKDALERIMEGDSEPAHMLNRRTILAATHCLQPSKSARIVIVTDNRWYARLICAIFVSVIRENSDLLQSMSAEFGHSQGLRALETFHVPALGRASAVDSVILFEGQPCQGIGHSDSNVGTSYFDRLWRTGAGKHADQRMRFIIVMNRIEVASDEHDSVEKHRLGQVDDTQKKRTVKDPVSNRAKKRPRKESRAL